MTTLENVARAIYEWHCREYGNVLPEPSLRDILAPLGNCARSNAEQFSKQRRAACQSDRGLCFHAAMLAH